MILILKSVILVLGVWSSSTIGIWNRGMVQHEFKPKPICDQEDASVYYYKGLKGVCPIGEVCDLQAAGADIEIPCKPLNRGGTHIDRRFQAKKKVSSRRFGKQ